MVDVVVSLPGPIAMGSDTPTPIGIHGGGAAANVASWLAVRGARATFVGRIGDDPFGLQAVDQLTADGVVPVVEIDQTRATGICVVLVDASGERSMMPSSGANDASADTGLLPTAADWLYVSGYALLNTGSRPFALAALALARERGWRLAVDAASAAPVGWAGAEQFLAWIGQGLLLFANAHEAAVLTGLDDPAAAARALARRCGEAVVKSGADGAVWSDGTQLRTVSAPGVTVLDSTGAGDAFAAGYLGNDGEVADRLAAAARAAGDAVARIGARPPRPRTGATGGR